MNVYNYSAILQNGIKHNGTILANSKLDCYQILCSKNYTPIKINRVLFINKKINTEDILMFFLHINFQLNCGVTINDAISSFIDSHNNQILNATLLDIINTIQAGEKISDAFARHRIFNSVIIGLLKSSECTGCVNEVVSSILNFLKLQANLRRDLKKVTAYPLFTVCIAIFVLMFCTHFLGPQIISLLQMVDGQSVPILTSFTIKFLPWISEICGVLLLICSVVILFISKKNSQILLQLIHKVPIIGLIIEKIFLWQVFKILHIGYIAKLDFLVAFKLALSSVKLKNLRVNLENAMVNILGGYKISTSFAKMPEISSDIITAIFVGEEGNNLRHTFNLISDNLYKEVMQKIDDFGNKLSVGLTLFTGLIFILVLCSLFQPLYTYVERMSM